VTRDPLEGLSAYFKGMETRQALLARAALGGEEPGDPAAAQRLRDRLNSEVREDGSVPGAALPTIWRAHELMDLGQTAAHPTTARVVGWILGLQGKPGAFAEGCDRPRHKQKLCAHYAAGFFAPAPAAERIAPITLPSGKVFRAEPAARFAVSCLALRAALRAGHGELPPIQRHVASLAGIAGRWTTWDGYFAPDSIVAGLHALALAGPAQAEVVGSVVGLVGEQQTPGGTWPGADLFHTLEALLAIDHPAAHAAVRRALPAIAARQRGDGALGSAARQERALIGLRAVLAAGAGPITPPDPATRDRPRSR